MANTLKVNLELLAAKFKSGLDSAASSVNKFKQKVNDANGSLNGQKIVSRDLETQYYRNQKALHKWGLSQQDLAKSARNFVGIGMIYQQAFSMIKSAISDSLNTFKDFQESTSNMKALTGFNDGDMKKLQEAALDLGKTTTQTATQVMKAFTDIALLRPDLLESADALKMVTENAIILAQAAKIDVVEAGKAIAMVMNQFDKSYAESISIINTLTAAQTKGSANVQYLTSALEKCGSVAHQYGASFQETIAAIETFAPKVSDGGSAGIYFRNVLQNLEKTNDQELMPSVVGVTKAFENLRDRNYDNITLLNLFQRRNDVVGRTLMNNTDKLRELTGEIDKNNEAMRQSDINTQNLAAAQQMLGSAWENLQLKLFDGNLWEGFLTNLTDAINGFTILAEKIKSIGSSMPEWLKWVMSPHIKLAKLVGENDTLSKIFGGGYGVLTRTGKEQREREKADQEARKKKEEEYAKQLQEETEKEKAKPQVDEIATLLNKEIEELTNEEIQKVIKALKKKMNTTSDATERNTLLNTLNTYKAELKERTGGTTNHKKTEAEKRQDAIDKAAETFKNETLYSEQYLKQGSKEFYEATKHTAESYLNVLKKNTDLSKASQEVKDLMDKLQNSIIDADKHIAKLTHVDNINKALDKFEDDTERLDYLFRNGLTTSKEYWESVKQYNESMVRAYTDNIDIHNATQGQLRAIQNYKKAAENATKQLQKIESQSINLGNKMPSTSEFITKKWDSISSQLINSNIADVWRNGTQHVNYKENLNPAEVYDYAIALKENIDELKRLKENIKDAYGEKLYDYITEEWKKAIKNKNFGETKFERSDAFVESYEDGTQAKEIANSVANLEQAIDLFSRMLQDIVNGGGTSNKKGTARNFDVEAKNSTNPNTAFKKAQKQVKFEIAKESVEGVDNLWMSSTRLVDTWKSLEEQWDSMDGWEKFTSIGDAIFDTINNVMSFIDTLGKLNDMFGVVASTRQTLTAVNQAGTAADVACAAASTSASIAETSAKSGEAIAGATASGAKLPFPYNLIAIATGVAAVIAALASIGSFADGGIIKGKTSIGDLNLARVNSGEMILNGSQQDRLFRILNGEGSLKQQTSNGGQVEFKIRGSELVGVLKNHQNKMSKVI